MNRSCMRRSTELCLGLVATLIVFAGCRAPAPSVTGLHVIVDWTNREIDQLEFAVTNPIGTALFAPQRRPAEAIGVLSAGADVIIYLNDQYGGTEVTCEVRAFRNNREIGRGSARALVQLGVTVRVDITLSAEADAGSPADAATDIPMDAPPTKMNGEACRNATECLSSFCVDGVCCNQACGASCRACNVIGKQGTCSSLPATARDSSCLQQAASTCGFDGTCDGLGSCRRYPAGTPCAPGTCDGSTISGAGTCNGKGTCSINTPSSCAPYNCDTSSSPPKCLTRCSNTDTDCVPGRVCTNSSCGKKYDGATCSTPAECNSGFCTNGVCCKEKCDTACVSCTEVGFVGTCRPVPTGVKDPQNVCKDETAATCGTTGLCDGTGRCAKYALNTVCKAAACASNATLTAASRCNSNGQCTAGGIVGCDPYACKDPIGCTSTCVDTTDCAPGRFCVAGKCGLKSDGQTCTLGSDCSSTFCVDGVCCENSCAGACRSCNIGTPGKCTMVVANAPDPHGVCINQGASTCGNDGLCNGIGECRKYPAGTECVPPSCSMNRYVVAASRCDGNGLCVDGGMTDCTPFGCNSSTQACYDQCADNAQCCCGYRCFTNFGCR